MHAPADRQMLRVSRKPGFEKSRQENYYRMKKILFALMCLSSFTSYAQNSFTRSTDRGFNVVATPVSSTSNELVRKIEIVGTGTTDIWYTFIIRVKNSDAKSDISSSLQSKSFTGEFSIEYEGNTIVYGKSLNGKTQALQRIDVSDNKAMNLSSRRNANLWFGCTVRTVHNCVAGRIDAMNWVSYAFCLVSAPACYAELWASCTWDVCFAQH